MKSIKGGKGFSLIELLIVMVLLSILVLIASGSYTSSARRARDNKRKSDLRSVATAIEAYYNDKSSYPQSNSGGEIVGCGAGDVQVCPWGAEMKDQSGTVYMPRLPKDPTESQKYFYVGGTAYKLYALLENDQDQGTGVSQAGYTSTNCSQGSTIKCTYGISSSNTTP